jgi:hypothetical protein
VTDPDPRRRIVHSYDIRHSQWNTQTWNYRVDADFPNAVLGDMTAVDRHRFMVIERDDAPQGSDARQKKIYLIDLRKVDQDGYLKKRVVLDLLDIRDPTGISTPARPGEFGVGPQFSFPLQSVESLEVLTRCRLLIANDTTTTRAAETKVVRDRGRLLPDDLPASVAPLVELRDPPLVGDPRVAADDQVEAHLESKRGGIAGEPNRDRRRGLEHEVVDDAGLDRVHVVVAPGHPAARVDELEVGSDQPARRAPVDERESLDPVTVADLIVWMAAHPGRPVLNEITITPLREAGWP